MAEKYGWIAKDKYGDFWLGTLCETERGVKVNLKKQEEWSQDFDFKIVKVKLMEVK